MTGAYFPPRAIKANEEAVRRSFAPRSGDGAVVPSTLSIISWMLATSVATIADHDERVKQLGRYLAVVEMEAALIASQNSTIDPGKDAHGEPVGGHA